MFLVFSKSEYFGLVWNLTVLRYLICQRFYNFLALNYISCVAETSYLHLGFI